MAITRKSRSIQLSALNDAIVGPFKVKEIRYGGATLTAGQRIQVLEEPNGSVVFDHVVVGVNEDDLVYANPGWVKGLLVSIMTGGGLITVILE
jgi:hypothetical protein